MLEEALRNEKYNPSEAAEAMLNFLQQQLLAGGSAQEARFYQNLYGPLCERIFGAISLNEKDNNYQHAQGGWLSVLYYWNRPNSSNSTVMITGTMSSTGVRDSRRRIPAPYPSGSSSSTGRQAHWENDPVVRLLATNTPLPKSNMPRSSVGNIASRGASIISRGGGRTGGMASPSAPSTAAGQDTYLPPTLIEAISTESENRPGVGISLPFFALPKPLQDAWMSILEKAIIDATTPMPAAPGGLSKTPRAATTSATSFVLTQNDIRLFRDLLRKPPLEQRPLLIYRQVQKGHGQQNNSQQQQQMGISPRAFQSPLQQHHQTPFRQIPQSPMTSPTQPNGNHSNVNGINRSPNPAASGAENKEQDTSPSVILSMLEYYLFLFLRFPLAMPPRTTTLNRNENPFGEVVYHYLFLRYLNHFLPYVSCDNRSIAFDDSLTAFNAPSSGVVSSELFLRTVIAFWMESYSRVLPTNKVVDSILERRRRSSLFEPLVLDLNNSYDLVQQTNAYTMPPRLVRRCMLRLIEHTMCDPNLHASILKLQKYRERRQQQLNEPQRDADGDVTMRGNGTTRSDGAFPNDLLVEWFLSPTMTALQQPFYNYIRSTLRYAPIHAPGSPFLYALDLWLMWLEPWNQVKSGPNVAKKQIIGSIGVGDRLNRSSNGVYLPRFGRSSLYDASWEPYIASNVLLYAVPLALFLRRSRELDFSPAKFTASIQLVRRVFRVFSPAVMEAVTRHLAAVESGCTLGSTIPMESQQLHHLVQLHVASIQPYAPPRGNLSLKSCQPDMHSLLEEIYTQHNKRVGDLDIFSRWAASFEGLFGQGVVTGEEKELQILFEQSRLIVSLPLDYQVFPGGSPNQAKSDASSTFGEIQLTRSTDGTLTKSGKEGIVLGQTKCQFDEVSYIGDLMYAPAGSHELEFLVSFFIQASDWLNAKFNLPAKEAPSDGSMSFGSICWRYFGFHRFDLRFLADYRNIVWLFLICVTFGLRKMIFLGMGYYLFIKIYFRK